MKVELGLTAVTAVDSPLLVSKQVYLQLLLLLLNIN